MLAAPDVVSWLPVMVIAAAASSAGKKAVFIVIVLAEMGSVFVAVNSARSVKVILLPFLMETGVPDAGVGEAGGIN